MQHLRMVTSVDDHQRESTLELSEALIAAYPEDADLWLARADAAMQTGQKAKALDALARAERLALDARQRRYLAQLRGNLQP